MPLKPTPLGDYLTNSEESAKELQHYPLDVALCNDCGHVYLPLVVQPQLSYDNYHFQSNASPGLINQFSPVVDRICAQTSNCGLKVIDIGSNDGSWLELFRARGFDTLGVEASPQASKAAASRGISTVTAFFGPEVASEIRTTRGFPDVITMNYMLANVPELHEFFKSIETISDTSTLISILTGYHPHQFNCSMFDYVYHEHLSYFTVSDLARLAEQHGLFIDLIEFVPLKGGSLHVILRKGKYEQNDAVNRYLQFEDWQGVRMPQFYESLMNRIDRAKIQTLESLTAKSKSGSPVYCYGVSHSVTTFNYELELASHYSGAVDDNADRWSLFTPGTGLRIESPEITLSKNECVVVVAAWQHDFRIRQRLSHLGFQGEVIQPLPRFFSSKVNLL
jgi:hypothetical protein